MYERSSSDESVTNVTLGTDSDAQERPVTPMQPTSPAPDRQSETEPERGRESQRGAERARETLSASLLRGEVSSAWTVDDHRRAVAAAQERGYGAHATTIN